MNQIKIGIILNYLSILITFGIGLVYTPFLIRTLGQSDYGLYAFAFAIAGYLSILDLGIGNSTVRYVSSNIADGDNKEKEKRLIGFFLKLFSYISIFTLAVGILIVINIESIISSDFSSNQVKELKWMLLILTLNFALGFLFNTFAAVIQAYERYLFLKIVNIIRTIAVPVISVIALFNIQHLVILTAILFLVNFTASISYFIYYKKVLKLKASFNLLDMNFKKEIFSYSIILFIVAIADKLYWQTDQILLGILKSPEDVAIYAVAIQFINIFISLSLAISNVFLPKITKMLGGVEYSIESLNELYIKISKYQTLIIGLTLSGFIILGQDFIGLWIGSQYRAAYFIVVILMAALSIDLIQNLGLTIMQAKGKYAFRAYTLITCSVLNIIISIPIIKEYGYIGTAYITSIFVLVGNVIILNFYFHNKLKLNMLNYWYEIGKLILIICLIAFLGHLLISNIIVKTWGMFFVAVVIYFLEYITLLFILYLSVQEKKKIIKIILNRI